MPIKHDHTHDKVRKAGSRVLPIYFELTYSTPTPIPIAGIFNGWHPRSQLHRTFAARRRSSNGD
jgi:hypothetical protein